MYKTQTACKPVTYLLAAVLMTVTTLGVHPTALFGQTNTTWKGGSGKWSEATKWTNGIPTGNFNAFIDGGNPLASLVTMDIGPSVVGLTVDAGDGLVIPDGASLIVSGNIANAGTISMRGSGIGTSLRFESPNEILKGAGKLTLSDNINNAIFGQFANASLVNQSTIQGAGVISVPLTNRGTTAATSTTGTHLIIEGGVQGVPVTNSGILEATNGATLELMNTVNNLGTIRAVKGTVLLNFTTVNNTGGTLLAMSGSTVLLAGATVNSGTLQTMGTGKFTQGSGIATVNGVTNAGTYVVQDGGSLALMGTITNTGTISLEETHLTTSLVLRGISVTLQGSGKVVGVFTIEGETGNETLINKSTIAGAGNIGLNLMGLDNQGTIIANQSTPLQIQTNSTGFRNTGTLSVTNGHELDIIGSFDNFSGSTLSVGTYAVTGTLLFERANILTNAANITLTGASSQIVDQNNNSALANFAANSSKSSFTLIGGRSFTTTGDPGQVFRNAGTVRVTSNCAFTVSGTTPTYLQTAGQTTVDGTLTAGVINLMGGSVFGTGTVSGSFQSRGTVNIGDALMQAGRLAIAGPYAQNSSGVLNADIGGTIAGTQYDQLNATGAASLAGTLNIHLINGFVPAVGDTFMILKCSSRGGKFTTVSGTGINPTEHFVVQYNSNNVTLRVVSGP